MSVDEFLRHAALFQGLDGQDLAELAAHAHTQAYRRGRMLHSLKRPSQIMSFVDQGGVRLYRLTAEGRQLTVNVRRPGQFFWQISLDAAGTPRSYAEATCDPTVVHQLPRPQFDALATRYPCLAVALIEELSRQLGDAYDRLEDVALRPVEGALAQALVRLADNDRARVEATHDELAAYVGTSRERVTKILRQWQAVGIIEQPYRREVCIVDARRLAVLGN